MVINAYDNFPSGIIMSFLSEVTAGRGIKPQRRFHATTRQENHKKVEILIKLI